MTLPLDSTTTTTQAPAARPRHCRSCQGTLDTFLDLGDRQLTGYLAPEELARPSAPLVLAACSSCRLVQLAHTTARELLFSHYWYRSGVNEVMRDELMHVVDAAVRRVGELKPGDIVLDIGANDGTLLSRYADYDSHQGHLMRIAYEPAGNLQEALVRHAELRMPDYFPDQFRQIKNLAGRVRIITSIAMFYAVDDLRSFLTAIKALLAEDGIWVVQFQDLAQMLRTTAFDNVVHEHLCYYSLATFQVALLPYGLAVTDVERRAINGGSYRVTVEHVGRPVSPHVVARLAEEAGCQDWPQLERFAWRVDEVRRQIRAVLKARITRGQVVDLYGASTKANTLLQVCGLDQRWLRQAWERSPEKWGLRTAGSDIPIVSEEDGRADPPDALFLGIWQFREAVIAREAAYLAAGGTLIVPLPAVEIATAVWRADVDA